MTSINNNTEILNAIPKFLFVFLREYRHRSKDVDAIGQVVFSRISFLDSLFLWTYSFGHLKSAKSSENGRLRKEKCQQSLHSENGRVGRVCRAESQRMRILKEREFEFCCSAEQNESIARQCAFVMPIPREKNLQSDIVFSNVFENSFIHEAMLSAIFRKSASFRSRRFRSLGSLRFAEDPKRIRQKYLGFLPKTE